MKKQGFTLLEILIVIATIAFLAAVVLPILSIAKTNAEQRKHAKAIQVEEEVKVIDPIPFGNNVFYFEKVGTNFAFALSQFLGSHTNLEVTGFAGDVQRQNRNGSNIFSHNSDYGATVGYIVVFKEKK